MTVPELVAVCVAAIGAVGSVAAAWVARQAAQNTKPISNGFASEVKGRLERIENLIVNHIEAHADHDVRHKGR
jgi:hypothetical protein